MRILVILRNIIQGINLQIVVAKQNEQIVHDQVL